MQRRYPNSQYRFHTTRDGSPSLEISYDDGLAEAMHNSAGAFEESLYIYGKVLEEGLSRLPAARVLSVGLGLGYNEFLTAAYSLKLGVKTDTLELVSFEVEDPLREFFSAYVFDSGEVPPEFETAYSWILDACAARFEISGEKIRERLQELHRQNRWILEKDFTPSTLPKQYVWNIFLYDAFSSKVSPQLWSEEALIHLFTNHSSTPCYFSTYAATGALKRSLKSSGFSVEDRAGFSGKRQSTYAVRVLSLAHLSHRTLKE